jgi:hypothetical protein
MSRAGLGGLERLDQDELMRRVNAAGPFEEDVARFPAGGLGEVVDEGEPLLAPLWANGELDNNEDHELLPSTSVRCSLFSTGGPAHQAQPGGQPGP